MKTTLALFYDPAINHLDIKADNLPAGEAGVQMYLMLLLRAMNAAVEQMGQKIVIANGTIPSARLPNG